MAKKRNWSYNTYGRNATRQGASFQAGGLEEYLQRIQAVGKNLDAAVKAAVFESSEIIYDSMLAGAWPHIRTGAVSDAITVDQPMQNGNYIFSGIGIDTDEHPEAIHAVFQEYGAPNFPADPFIRPAFDNNKGKVKKKQREVLIREGMPIE